MNGTWSEIYFVEMLSSIVTFRKWELAEDNILHIPSGFPHMLTIQAFTRQKYQEDFGQLKSNKKWSIAIGWRFVSCDQFDSNIHDL